MKLALSLPTDIEPDQRKVIEGLARQLSDAIRAAMPAERQGVPGYLTTVALRYALACSDVDADDGLQGLAYILANYCVDYGRAMAAEKGNRHGPVYGVQAFQHALGAAGGTLSQIYKDEKNAADLVRLLRRRPS